MKKRIGNELGQLGEDIACKYLKSKGFDVIERNYQRKWGEIDIIVKKLDITHFVEVKTVSADLGMEGNLSYMNPIDNIHEAKVRRLSRAIETYVTENKLGEGKWQVGAVLILLDKNTKKAKVSMLEHIF